MMDAEIDTLKNEVLRKIGRNLMLFQQVEHMLKFLLANGVLAGHLSELKPNKEQREQQFQKQTMGQLVGNFLEKTFSRNEEVTNVPEKVTEPWFSFRHTIECDSDYYEERKNSLALIVDERNDLIHHLLPKWDTHSSRSCTEIERYLDKQRENILPEFEFLKDVIKTRQEIGKEVADFLLSDEGKQCFITTPSLTSLRQSPLVAWLCDIAKQRSRADGWAILSTAAQIIHTNAPQAITDLEKRYGYKKLKAAILATAYFDVTEEPTDKGGIRVLYRIKPELIFAE